MEKLQFQYQTAKPICKPAHIGVVGSGDLEIIVEPVKGQTTNVSILTGSEGFGQVWENVLTRFLTVIRLLPILQFMTSELLRV